MPRLAPSGDERRTAEHTSSGGGIRSERLMEGAFLVGKHTCFLVGNYTAASPYQVTVIVNGGRPRFDHPRRESVVGSSDLGWSRFQLS